MCCWAESFLAQRMERRRSVAIYVNRFSFVLPVHPVGTIERPTPEDRRQQQSKQDTSTFRAILNAAMQAEAVEGSNDFEALV